jgi:outer membrane immunogenic protein
MLRNCNMMQRMPANGRIALEERGSNAMLHPAQWSFPSYNQGLSAMSVHLRKSSIVIAIATAAVASLPAFAADMPQRAPVYKAAPAPIDYFSGWFVGGELGYGWGRGKVSTNVLPTDFTFKPDGLVAGLNLGYRWRTAPNGYFGIVTAIDYLDLKDTLSVPGPGIPATAKQRWLGTTGVQFGALFAPTVHAYVGGGLAYGDAKADATFLRTTYSISDTKVGWYLGAGFDVAMGNNWTWGAEYKYVDLGKVRGNWSGINASSDVSDNIVMVNLKYRFAN